MDSEAAQLSLTAVQGHPLHPLLCRTRQGRPWTARAGCTRVTWANCLPRAPCASSTARRTSSSWPRVRGLRPARQPVGAPLAQKLLRLCPACHLPALERRQRHLSQQPSTRYRLVGLDEQRQRQGAGWLLAPSVPARAALACTQHLHQEAHSLGARPVTACHTGSLLQASMWRSSPWRQRMPRTG